VLPIGQEKNAGDIIFLLDTGAIVCEIGSKPTIGVAMAKHEGACPIATRKFILSQAQRLKVDIIRVIEDYAKEAGIPVGTLRNWVWPESQVEAKAERRNKAKESSKFTTSPEPDPVITEEDFTAPPEKVVRYKNTDAMYFVKLAILQLDSIKTEDPEHMNALNFLSDYISKRIDYLTARRKV